jgi:hypothetical protein
MEAARIGVALRPKSESCQEKTKKTKISLDSPPVFPYKLAPIRNLAFPDGRGN